MSIYGIDRSALSPSPSPVSPAGRDTARVQGQPAATRVPTPSQLVTQSQPAAQSAPGISNEAPPGTDLALWSVLSGEERAFFAKAGAMGPLTYGRAFSDMKAAQMPAHRGGRLDVKI